MEYLNIFISWSGPRSKAVATFLSEWIQDVIQLADPWVSATDIDAGARWNRDIDEKLRDTNFGIICLTKNNLAAPWILFEAGALAKTLDDTFVCPYLIDLEPSDIPRGPLTQFQAKRANETETWELIQTINKALKENALPEDRLRRLFDRCWPELEAVLGDLPEEVVTSTPLPSLDTMVKEILDVVRGLSRRDPPDITFIDSMDLVRSLEEQPDKTDEARQPQIWAAPGSGKTHLLSALLGEYLRKESKYSTPQSNSLAENRLKLELDKRNISYDNRYRISSYIPDLYLDVNGVRLAVEVDGPAHFSNPKVIDRDRQKDNLMAAEGVRVLRFSVSEVLNDPVACADKIESILRPKADSES